MEIELRIKCNCSEWDSEVESDDYIDLSYDIALKKKLAEEAKKEIQLKGWDQ